MGNESRYDQYDLNITLPEPLVPRHLRLAVPERLDNEGNVLLPLDEAAVRALLPVLRDAGVQSLAVGFLHAFVNPQHEQRVREIVAEALPDVPVSLSSEVSPEMREWERFSTTVANAYVQPLMARYLRGLEAGLRGLGVAAPVFLMLSGGGLTTIETACRFPIRLVESGPAGGAIFSASIARECGLAERAVVRHGRHHGEDLPDRQFQAADRAGVRSRAGRAVPQRIGAAAADSGDRDGGDRRRRRFSGARRCDGADRGRAGERRRRSGTRLLRTRRDAAGRDGREPDAGTLRCGALRRRVDGAGRSGGASCAGGGGGRQAGPDRGDGGARRGGDGR